jgi:two-component system phosphate regulon sensor histidine kinase PhoR
MFDKIIKLDKEVKLRLYSLIDNLPFYVLIVDEDHRIVLANKVFLEQIELNLDEVIGEYCPKLVHGANGPIPECPLERSVVTKESQEIEVYDEANKRWIISSVFPLNWSTNDGKRLFLHFAQDITMIKQGEEKKDILSYNHEKELQKLNKVKKEFITQAEHELKTPLMSIAGYTEYILAKYKDLDQEVIEDLLIVQKNIERLDNYIHNIVEKMKNNEDLLNN